MQHKGRMHGDGTFNIPAAAAVPGASANLGNGTLLVIKGVDGTDITADYELHPVIPLVLELLATVREEATDKGAQAIIQAIMLLAANAPQVTAVTINDMLTEALPWPTELAFAQLKAGRPVEGFNGSGAQKVIVNFDPTIEMKVPAVEEEIVDIRRDQAGFIQSATKTRRRKQTAAV